MKLKRNERIGAIVKILTEHPNKTFTLSYFTEKFNTAKSTLSEDVMLVKSVFERMKLGRVITIPGASGGVRYIPDVSKDEVYNFLQTISKKIQSEDRVLPGGFLYLIDIINSFCISQRLISIKKEKCNQQFSFPFFLPINRQKTPLLAFCQ